MQVTWKIVAGLLLWAGFMVSAGSAVQLRLDDEGRLTGAAGVLIDGQTYRVDFVDGTCESVYGGCTKEAYFFESVPGYLAVVALFEQVLVGEFDSDPRRIRGCTGSDAEEFDVCEILFPVGFAEFERQCGDCGYFDIPFVIRLFNTAGLPDILWVNEWYYDELADGWRTPNGGEHLRDTRVQQSMTWVRFTAEESNPVSAPSSLLLIMTGWMVLSAASFRPAMSSRCATSNASGYFTAEQ